MAAPLPLSPPHSLPSPSPSPSSTTPPPLPPSHPSPSPPSSPFPSSSLSPSSPTPSPSTPPPTIWLLPPPQPPLSSSYLLHPQPIGRGQFGVIHTCEHRESGKTYAVKTIEKTKLETEEHVQALRMEILSLSLLSSHPSIVPLVHVGEERERIHLVMEHCRGGDLFRFIKARGRVREREASWIFRKIARAVQYCHQKGVLHRDLKPENILLQVREGDGVVEPKLCDFGLAKILKPGQKTKGFAGSPFYMCPEAVSGKEYGTEADVWSLGVLLFTILSGNLPFRGKTAMLTLAAVCTGRPDYTKDPWPSISVPSKKLVFRMLSVDPKLRPTMSDIVANPWVNGNIFENRTDNGNGNNNGSENTFALVNQMLAEVNLKDENVNLKVEKNEMPEAKAVKLTA